MNKLFFLKKLYIYGLVIFCLLLLSTAVRGEYGNPNSTDLLTKKWQTDGPLELSPERGRFALLYSIVEDKSLTFSSDLGKFATPDVAISRGKYASLFAPLLSFAAIPGYIIGKFFGISQVGAYTVVAIFAVLNCILLRSIAIRLGANSIAASIAALIFLFGTPAFSYAVTIYQHHLSTFLILLSIWVLLQSKKAWSLALVFFLCAAAIPLDYPNLFFMFPIGIYALGRIISYKKFRKRVTININMFKMLTPLVMIIPILFFLWFNNASYGNPFQLSGTLPTNKYVSGISGLSSEEIASQVEQRHQVNIKSGKKTSTVNFFKTRGLINGFYIHFVSPDRGIMMYTPVVLFGIIGFILALKKKVQMTSLLGAIVGANILLYSMWGDPWGGWAFGSRYLIPSYAILSIFIALLLVYWNKNIIFLCIFIIVSYYSIAVNTLGAITTSAIPPQAEVLSLEKLSGVVQRYTYQRNWEFLLSGHSKSFVYQTYLKKYITPIQFYRLLVFSIYIALGGLMAYYVAITNKKGESSNGYNLEDKKTN